MIINISITRILECTVFGLVVLYLPCSPFSSDRSRSLSLKRNHLSLTQMVTSQVQKLYGALVK